MNKIVKCGCGGEAEIFHIAPEGYEGSYCVRCTKCLTQTPFFNKDKDKAIEVWNRAMGALLSEGDPQKNNRCECSNTTERTAKVENYQDPFGFGGYRDCSECGAEVNEQYTYCPNCGCRLEWE